MDASDLQGDRHCREQEQPGGPDKGAGEGTAGGHSATVVRFRYVVTDVAHAFHDVIAIRKEDHSDVDLRRYQQGAGPQLAGEQHTSRIHHLCMSANVS